MGAYLMTPDGVTTLRFDVVTSESWDEDTEVTEYNVEDGADVTDNVRVALRICNLSTFSTNEPLGSNSFDQADLALLPITIDAPGQDAPSVTSITVPQWDNGIALRAALTGVGDVVGGALGGATGTIIGGAVGALAGALIGGPGEHDLTIKPAVGIDPTPGASVNAQTYQFTASSDFVQQAIDQLRAWKNAAQLLTVVGTKGSVDNMVIQKLNIQADAETGTGRAITLALKEVRIVTTTTVNAPKPTIPRAKTPVPKGAQNTTPQPPTKSMAEVIKGWFSGMSLSPSAEAFMDGLKGPGGV